MFKNIPLLPRKATTEDPLSLYLIVNKDLNMGTGKVGAQCGHAVQYFIEYDREESTSLNLDHRIYGWKNNSRIGKIVLGANTNEFNKLKEDYDPIVVVDAGLTQIAAGSETVICLYPMFKDERCKLLKRLQLLK